MLFWRANQVSLAHQDHQDLPDQKVFLVTMDGKDLQAILDLSVNEVKRDLWDHLDHRV